MSGRLAGKTAFLTAAGQPIGRAAAVAFAGHGSIKGAPSRFVYGTTKAAAVGLAKSVAADFGTRAIHCNAIGPGTVMSPSLRERIAARSHSSGESLAQVEAALAERQPMGRLPPHRGTAALAFYLASDESIFTTGTAQIIDGGSSN